MAERLIANARMKAGEISSAVRQQAVTVFERVDNDPRVLDTLNRHREPLGQALRVLTLPAKVDLVRFDDEMQFVHEQPEVLQQAYDYLQNGVLVAGFPIHRSIADGPMSIRILEKLFGHPSSPNKKYKRHVWPWSYKFDPSDEVQEIEDLPEGFPNIMRIGVSALAEASGLEQVFVVQPRHRRLTERNQVKLLEYERKSKERLAAVMEPGTLMHMYLTGTRGKEIQRTDSAIGFYLRHENVAILPLMARPVGPGGKYVQVAIGNELVTHSVVRNFQRNHEWDPNFVELQDRKDPEHPFDPRFTYDDAVMAYTARTLTFPKSANGLDQRGVYAPGNYREKIAA